MLMQMSRHLLAPGSKTNRTGNTLDAQHQAFGFSELSFDWPQPAGLFLERPGLLCAREG